MSIVKKPGALSNWYLPGIIKGMIHTFSNMIRNLLNKDKMPTLNYPEEHYEYGPRFKGNHVLTVKKDGSLRCTACMLRVDPSIKESKTEAELPKREAPKIETEDPRRTKDRSERELPQMSQWSAIPLFSNVCWATAI